MWMVGWVVRRASMAAIWTCEMACEDHMTCTTTSSHQHHMIISYHRMASHDMTCAKTCNASHPITIPSHPIPSPYLRIASHRIVSHPIISHRITSLYDINTASHHIASHRIVCHVCISSCLTSSCSCFPVPRYSDDSCMRVVAVEMRRYASHACACACACSCACCMIILMQHTLHHGTRMYMASTWRVLDHSIPSHPIPSHGISQTHRIASAHAQHIPSRLIAHTVQPRIPSHRIASAHTAAATCSIPSMSHRIHAVSPTHVCVVHDMGWHDRESGGCG